MRKGHCPSCSNVADFTLAACFLIPQKEEKWEKGTVPVAPMLLILLSGGEKRRKGDSSMHLNLGDLFQNYSQLHDIFIRIQFPNTQEHERRGEEAPLLILFQNYFHLQGFIHINQPPYIFQHSKWERPLKDTCADLPEFLPKREV